jgi:hypothetical protein
MSISKKNTPQKPTDALFDRVAMILEQARVNIVRTVNTNMVQAYWFIGREIVESVQGGENRAAYRKRVIEDLSTRLTEPYGKGYSFQILRKFRLFLPSLPSPGSNSIPTGLAYRVNHGGTSR